MPITISSICNTCRGDGFTHWMHNDVPWTQPCKECGGSGKAGVVVRTVYDTLADALNLYAGVVSAPNTDKAPVGDPCLDCAAPIDSHACACRLPHTDKDTCSWCQPDPAPDAGNRLDHDRGADTGTADPAATCGQVLPDRDVECDERDRGLRTPAGGCVHRPSGEGLIGYSDSMNAGLERWK